MTDKLTIGAASRRSGVPVRTIRFYEEYGLIPPPARTDAGYRLYTPTDMRRLQLIRRARLLGLSLHEVKIFVDRAFRCECLESTGPLLERVLRYRAEIYRRIATLEALKGELHQLEQHVRHSQAMTQPGQWPVECPFCLSGDAEPAY